MRSIAQYDVPLCRSADGIFHIVQVAPRCSTLLPAVERRIGKQLNMASGRLPGVRLIRISGSILEQSGKPGFSQAPSSHFAGSTVTMPVEAVPPSVAEDCKRDWAARTLYCAGRERHYRDRFYKRIEAPMITAEELVMAEVPRTRRAKECDHERSARSTHPARCLNVSGSRFWLTVHNHKPYSRYVDTGSKHGCGEQGISDIRRWKWSTKNI